MSLPQTEENYRAIGSHPHWVWGFSHGFNEHQVVIGNGALKTKVRRDQPALVGMDLVRLTLVRSRSALQAVDVMTCLIARYGQGQFQGGDPGVAHDNAFLIADPFCKQMNGTTLKGGINAFEPAGVNTPVLQTICPVLGANPDSIPTA